MVWVQDAQDDYHYWVGEAAQRLHSSTIGTSDPLPKDEEARIVSFLRMKLIHWTPTVGYSETKFVDEAFRELVRAVLDEHKAYTTHGPGGPGGK